MWNLSLSWIPVSFFKQKQGGCKSFGIIDHLSNLLQMHFNKLATSESNILSPFVNSLLNARLKIANSLNWKCSFCEEKPASTKGFNYWQAHLTTFFNKLSHITVIPENVRVFSSNNVFPLWPFLWRPVFCALKICSEITIIHHTHIVFFKMLRIKWKIRPFSCFPIDGGA